jgi:hypothetical protein
MPRAQAAILTRQVSAAAISLHPAVQAAPAVYFGRRLRQTIRAEPLAGQSRPDSIGTLLEEALILRFDDLNSPDRRPRFLDAAREKTEQAQRAALCGNISVTKRLRLLCEDARLVWHG